MSEEEMDSTIVSAIIGAIAIIMAVLIGILRLRPRNKNIKGSFQKSKAFYLGFVLGELEFLIETQKNDRSPERLQQVIEKCKTVASTAGILNTPNIPAELVGFLPIRMKGERTEFQAAFEIGNIIGRNYYFGIKQIGAGGVPANETLKSLGDAESLIVQAEFPRNFLSPVRKFWNKTIAAAQTDRKCLYLDSDKEMERILDQLTKFIETGTKTSYGV